MAGEPSRIEGRAWVGLRGDRYLLDEKTKEVTESPGVYVYRGSGGEVLYVGKANNLRKRLRSYFASNLPPKTEALMERVASLETIAVESEVEALILELNLIKKHRPKYNILLTDDKQYPYIRVGLNEPWPRVTVARRMQRDGARYFGPFTRGTSVRETLTVLRRLFPYRNCSDKVLAQTTRPCLDYHINRCLAPCAGKVDEATYDRTISECIKFLEGRHREVRESLQKSMNEAAEKMEYERAARIRDQIRSLDDITEKQRIVSPDMKDRDILGLARASDNAFVALLPVRQGKIMGKDGFILQSAGSEDDAGILEAFITQYYSLAPFIPGEIVVPVDLSSRPEIEAFLRAQKKANEARDRVVRLRAPKRGRLKGLVNMACDNAKTMMADIVPRVQREKQHNLEAMTNLAKALGMKRLPIRIEGYDISNISGQETVASMVVLSDGRPDKSQYRKFRMRLQGKPDDFAMMQEVLWRRFKRGLSEREEMKTTGRGGKFSVFPDLILVDGGKGQVSAARKVLDELNLDIPLAGLAKKNEEIYLPGCEEPLVLPRDSGALYLVMRLRDEAHRFALAYHRRLRGQRGLRSALSEIRGIGPAKLRGLLNAFGDVDSIRNASIEEIAKVKGIGPALAQKISTHLKKKFP
jgi:excinuclease ABC subunit C